MMNAELFLNDCIRVSWQSNGPAPKVALTDYLQKYPHAATYLNGWVSGLFWETLLDFGEVLSASPELLVPDSNSEEAQRKLAERCVLALERVAESRGYSITVNLSIEALGDEDSDFIGTMDTNIQATEWSRSYDCDLTLWLGQSEQTPWNETVRLIFHEFRHSIQALLSIPSLRTDDELHPCEVDARLFQQNLFIFLFENPVEQELRPDVNILDRQRRALSLFRSDRQSSDQLALTNLVTHLEEGVFPAPGVLVSALKTRVAAYAAMSDFFDFIDSGLDTSQSTLEQCIENLQHSSRSGSMLLHYAECDWIEARLNECLGYCFERLAKMQSDAYLLYRSASHFLQALIDIRSARLLKYIGICLWQYKVSFEAIKILSDYGVLLFVNRSHTLRFLAGNESLVDEVSVERIDAWPDTYAGCIDLYNQYKSITETDGHSNTALDFFFYGGLKPYLNPEYKIAAIESINTIQSKKSALTYFAYLLGCEDTLQSNPFRSTLAENLAMFVSCSNLTDIIRLVKSSPLFMDSHLHDTGNLPQGIFENENSLGQSNNNAIKRTGPAHINAIKDIKFTKLEDFRVTSLKDDIAATLIIDPIKIKIVPDQFS